MVTGQNMLFDLKGLDTMKTHAKSYIITICWLVGWLGFTALQHFIGYTAPVSVVNVRMSENECTCRAGGVVPPCTLEQWVKSPPRIPLGVCAEFDGGQTILHSRVVGIFYPPPNPQEYHREVTTGNTSDPCWSVILRGLWGKHGLCHADRIERV